MCDCHPQTPAERAEWNRVKHEPRTREDWADLHDTIEQFKRRLIARHRNGRNDHAAAPTRVAAKVGAE